MRPYTLEPFVSNETARDLVARYEEPQRFYHNVDHLDDCLYGLSHLRSFLSLEELSHHDVMLAGIMIWFHDAVYEIGPDVEHGDNEKASAKLFLKSDAPKNLSLVEQNEIAKGILLSSQHTVYCPNELTEAQKIFLDLDLHSMGRSYDTFIRNGENIRKEYAWVPEDTFTVNRAKFFDKLLARPYIYYNHVMRGLYETNTRNNINKWLKEVL